MIIYFAVAIIIIIIIVCQQMEEVLYDCWALLSCMESRKYCIIIYSINTTSNHKELFFTAEMHIFSFASR